LKLFVEFVVVISAFELLHGPAVLRHGFSPKNKMLNFESRHRRGSPYLPAPELLRLRSFLPIVSSRRCSAVTLQEMDANISTILWHPEPNSRSRHVVVRKWTFDDADDFTIRNLGVFLMIGHSSSFGVFPPELSSGHWPCKQIHHVYCGLPTLFAENLS
jgi:hypothetical protein